MSSRLEHPANLVAFSCLTIANALLIALLAVFNVAWRNERFVKMTSPRINLLSLLGSALILAASVLPVAAADAEFWRLALHRGGLAGAGISLSMAAAGAKCFRAWLAFRVTGGCFRQRQLSKSPSGCCCDWRPSWRSVLTKDAGLAALTVAAALPNALIVCCLRLMSSSDLVSVTWWQPVALHSVLTAWQLVVASGCLAAAWAARRAADALPALAESAGLLTAVAGWLASAGLLAPWALVLYQRQQLGADWRVGLMEQLALQLPLLISLLATQGLRAVAYLKSPAEHNQARCRRPLNSSPETAVGRDRGGASTWLVQGQHQQPPQQQDSSPSGSSTATAATSASPTPPTVPPTSSRASSSQQQLLRQNRQLRRQLEELRRQLNRQDQEVADCDEQQDDTARSIVDIYQLDDTWETRSYLSCQLQQNLRQLPSDRLYPDSVTVDSRPMKLPAGSRVCEAGTPMRRAAAPSHAAAMHSRRKATRRGSRLATKQQRTTDIDNQLASAACTYFMV
ncbi:hypothetical protein BOX15_Mlig030628g1 [Macrostomum lignano]|uniref:Uncharacterized protein n=1 Tax=Macrostomum lignano TaxID=282301 RepID=A0A267GJ05_9PLAT|nr:hypothetical protein BOX15_Mlig030628g1 [Macrostomum lignano]